MGRLWSNDYVPGVSPLGVFGRYLNRLVEKSLRKQKHGGDGQGARLADPGRSLYHQARPL